MQDNHVKRKARILIVDDHPLVCEGLTLWISRRHDMEVCGEADNEEAALAKVEKLQPDLVIVDLKLKTGHGFNVLKRIRESHPDTKTLVSSMHEETLYAERSLKAGARGYISKAEAPEKVVDAICQVLQGDVYLSSDMMQDLIARGVGVGLDTGKNKSSSNGDLPVHLLSNRELELFELIGEGLGTSQIAERLNIKPNTIDTHRANIRNKLGLKNGNELVRFAVQWTTRQNG